VPKWIKVLVFLAAALIVLIVAAVLLVPSLIDLNTYKPRIEAQLSAAVGIPVKLNGPIEPSLFPFIGAKLSDVRLKNPPGFPEDDMAMVNTFEVRVRLIPLLKRHVEVSRFVIKEPQITLIKHKNGRGNWEALGPSGPAGEQKPSGEKTPPDSSGGGGPTIENLVINEFSISDGHLVFFDQSADTRKEINKINLLLDDTSLSTPVKLSFSAIADNKPLSVEGVIGPVGAQPGKDPIPLDLRFSVLEQIASRVRGQVHKTADSINYSLTATIDSFSPRQLLEQFQKPPAMRTTDDQVLRKFEATFQLSGDEKSVQVSDGKMTLDDSRIAFSGRASEFQKPVVKLEATVDRINLDRYLPPPDDAKQPGNGEKSPSEAGPQEPAKPQDYSSLRDLVLEGNFKAGEIIVKNARLQNLQARATARNGIINLDPIIMQLYSGRLAIAAKVDVRDQTPRTTLDAEMSGVQAGPLQEDLLEKERILGTVAANLDLRFTGDGPEEIRRSLSGNGNLAFTDGAIVGIDLAGMVRNVGSAFGLMQNPTQKPKTDFSELILPFTIRSGVISVEQAQLQSPLMRVAVEGTANLASEELKMRVEPKFVATLVGQGDTQQRSGLMVPVIVGGKISDPQFRPDLESIVKQQLPNEKQLRRKANEEVDRTKQKIQTDLEEKARDLMRGLPFGGAAPSREFGN